MSESTKFDGWAVVEFMGHVRTAGYVSEQTIAGVAMLRVDVPETATGANDGFTRYWHPNALYSLSPVGESVARHVAANNREPPVRPWDLPQPHLQALANRAEVVEDDEADQWGRSL